MGKYTETKGKVMFTCESLRAKCVMRIVHQALQVMHIELSDVSQCAKR
jgi:hypothetical protein